MKKATLKTLCKMNTNVYGICITVYNGRKPMVFFITDVY